MLDEAETKQPETVYPLECRLQEIREAAKDSVANLRRPKTEIRAGDCGIGPDQGLD